MKSLLVIDASPTIRETLRIVLGREHDVSLARSCELASPEVPPSLVILGLPPPPRDDRSAANALARIAPDAPLLLLHPPGEVDVPTLATPARRVDFLPKPFDAYTLRERVRALLADDTSRMATDADAVRPFLEYPFLTKTAAMLAHDALAADVPVLFTGERGTGAFEVARALHALSGRSGPFRIRSARTLGPGELVERRADAGGGGSGALFIDDVDAASLEVQHALLGLMHGEIERADTRVPRLLASTTADLEARVSAGAFLPELSYALGMLTIPLAPLRDRVGDIPALVEWLTKRLTTRLRLEPVTYSAGAIEKLTQYLWFGNVAELAAVIGRTLAVHRSRMIEPSQLLFVPGMAREDSERPAAAAPRPPSGIATGTAYAPALEIVLGELAHELRNPMVTIKTFTQHLDSVMADPEVRERFANLATDAVGRMDALLETLLDFARFRAPVPHSTDLRALLDRALDERTDELARKDVRVERDGTGTSLVETDEAQMLFALRSLLEGVLRDVRPHEPVRVHVHEGGRLELELHAEPSIAERLSAWVEGSPGTNDAGTPPLPVALASSLIRRNGGRLETRRGDAGTVVITVTLPAAR